MKIHYKGRKAKVPVYLPIGVKSRGATKATLWADPFLELSDKDGHALVLLDPHNFETELEYMEAQERIEVQKRVEEEMRAKRGPGRPKKDIDG